MLIQLALQLCVAVFASDVRPMNCVNPGGSCTGEIPCCGESYCIRNVCRHYPAIIASTEKKTCEKGSSESEDQI